jgi:1-acyl-sn-glycerol-3-phosphate acyltransferase
MCEHIPIDRKASVSAFKKVIRLGKERLLQGLSIVIFPEGTRVAPRHHPKFHRTAVILALEAGVPVIPVAHNSGSCWTRNSFFKTPGLITVVIGKPIPSTGKTAEALNQEVYEWIKNEMETLEKEG